MQAEGQHVQDARGRKAHGALEAPKARAAIRREAGAETAEAEPKPGADRPWGPRWNFAPRGAREGPEQKKSGSQTSPLPSLRGAPSPPPAPCSLPGPRAPTPAPLTAAQASVPWRTLSSTPSRTPPPPSSARRPARRTRGARGAAGKWSPSARPPAPARSRPAFERGAFWEV